VGIRLKSSSLNRPELRNLTSAADARHRAAGKVSIRARFKIPLNISENKSKISDMDMQTSGILSKLEALDFDGKGEAFVESRFLTPLLECLGYEIHNDYEVIRHGDDGSAFKLQYPPVEKGAVKVRHYSPDYIPTIRKKAFWVIEAKSPTVSYPFEDKFLVQGLQYCIHPEIQAKYLVVSNGSFSAVYDAHGSVFLGKDIYEPILTFSSSEIRRRWSEIYDLLSTERLRTQIETDIKSMYDKLCLSSLDDSYPAALIRRIGASGMENSYKIKRHVSELSMNAFTQKITAWQAEMERLDPTEVFARMGLPLHVGGSEATYFVEKSMAAGRAPIEILNQLIADFDRQSIFRKEQTFAAVGVLYNRNDDGAVKESAREFLDRYKEGDLPILNQVECTFLRIGRKMLILAAYPGLRQRLRKELESVPEMVRFVSPPTALDLSYASEVAFHALFFEKIKQLDGAQLNRLLDPLLSAERSIEEDFKTARSKLTGGEAQLGGAFEYYGINGKHYAFKNIMKNLKIE